MRSDYIPSEVLDDSEFYTIANEISMYEEAQMEMIVQ